MRSPAVVIVWCVLAALVSEAQAKRVACVGTGITQGFQVTAKDAYPSQLARLLRQYDDGWEVGNFGRLSTTVLRKTTTTAYVQTNEFARACAWDPNVVVIQLGITDALPANWVHKADFLSDFLVVIDAFAQLPSQPTIYVWIPTPTFANPYGFDNRVITDELIPLVRQLPSLRGVRLIDMYPSFAGRPELFADGVHPNAAGAGLMAQIVAATLVGMRVPPDFNGDWKVDIEDLVLLIDHWGRNEPALDIAPPPFGDGIVDRQDLEVLMTCWGRELIDPALLAYWKLDESAGNLAQNRAGGDPALLHGDAVWQPAGGKIGGALQFDGNDDYVTTGFIPDPAQGPFSVFAWVKGGAPGQVVLAQTGGANWLCAAAPAGVLATELKAPGRSGKPLTSSVVITDGAWHRVGLVWDNKNRVLFVDGAEAAKDAQPSPAAGATELILGADGALTPGFFWSGLIDDVRIYDRPIKP